MQGYSDVSQMLRGGNQPTLNMEKHNNEYISPNFNNKCCDTGWRIYFKAIIRFWQNLLTNLQEESLNLQFNVN